MNLIEAVELLDDILDFDFEDLVKKPNINLYDRQKDGFVLCLKADSVTEEYRDYIEEIAESRKLRIRESEGYLTIQR